MTELSDKERDELQRLRVINKALRQQVQANGENHSVDSFALFQSALILEKQVRTRGSASEALSRQLTVSNQKLLQLNIALTAEIAERAVTTLALQEQKFTLDKYFSSKYFP